MVFQFCMYFKTIQPPSNLLLLRREEMVDSRVRRLASRWSHYALKLSI